MSTHTVTITFDLDDADSYPDPSTWDWRTLLDLTTPVTVIASERTDSGASATE